jgi:midasin
MHPDEHPASSSNITMDDIDHDHCLPLHQIQEIRRMFSEKHINPLLNHLSDLLFQEESVCSAVASCFRPLLQELLVRGCTKASNEQKFVTLSHLIGFHDVATQFAHSLHDDSSLTLPALRGEQTSDQVKYLKACLTFLWWDYEFSIKAFDWSPVFELTESQDASVAWLATQCQNVITGCPLHDTGHKLSSRFPSADFDSIRIQYHDIFKGRSSDSTECDLAAEIVGSLQQSDLSDGVVSVNGALLSKVTCENNQLNTDIILTGRFRDSLSLLANKVRSSTPVIVMGPVGCGKSSLIEYLAQMTGRNGHPSLTKVQLGDQIDSKLLVGGYYATEVPGEFVWRPGPLTTAMMHGHWILFEDLDSAAPDVLSILMTASKTVSLSSLPGCNVTSSKNDQFRMFFTVRSYSESVIHLPSELTRACPVIELKTPDDPELAHIISEGYPTLKPIIPSIVGTYRLAASSSDVRPVTLRDMVKWCHRIGRYFTGTSHNAAKSAFKDAIDCFVPNPVIQSDKVQVLGTHLNISKNDALLLALDESHRPVNSRHELQIGRVSLKITDQDILSQNRTHKSFAFTHQSLVLVERIAAAIHANEPILLVGETGTGKTSTVQFIAQEIGKQLIVVNLNQQTDSCDLVGGYKPSDLTVTFTPLLQSFSKLVLQTFRNKAQNAIFVQKVTDHMRAKQYVDVCKIIADVSSRVKTDFNASLTKQWNELVSRVNLLSDQVKQNAGKSVMVFAFIEGSLVKAMREGHWILLDEINLAEADTLQSLCHVLDSHDSSVVLVDKADGSPVTKHPDFRIFACMNPATDIGKKDLPVGVRNRFTEFHVNELQDERDLRILVEKYLPATKKTESIIQFYIAVRKKCMTILTDTCGHRPHFSLRTLCRALTIAASNPCQDVNRSLYEAFCLSFLTQLNASSKVIVSEMIGRFMIGDPKSVKACLGRPIPQPSSDHTLFEGYWLPPGPNNVVTSSSYILTPSVRRNIADLCRILSLGKTIPVLLQGETSLGKTSLIQWLAQATGNVCRRVNNHEHTDLEEYVGSYGSDVNGNLIFREGVLVEAMRKGHWIILDELNLAPTEVLEALNRVLDDNRELFIPETQITVKAHPNFVLFATQNPPGLYAGRKILSRAFRNRFIELHFDEIPADELIVILEKRCLIPASYAKKMVLTMSDLQRNRRGSEIFAGKSGFITLRDLFRWGDRFRIASQSIEDNFYEWEMFLAEMGFMVLAARVRKPEEEDLVRQALEKRFLKNKQTLDVVGIYHKLFCEMLSDESPPDPFGHIVATDSFRRLVALVWSALKFKEPVLLVGETGCGKTSICQLYALLHRTDLKAVNCHMHSESSDFLGNLRPVRSPEKDGPLFQWVDGPLVDAMRQGSVFLMDEISLADDSVLERLNSILEPERTLMLSEKGLDDADPESLVIHAQESFRFVATMNPGGDYGKKELSPALRNRFTEIWCPSTTSKDEMGFIIRPNLKPHLHHQVDQIASIMTDFFFWFVNKLPGSTAGSVRDILSWLSFVNAVTVDDCDGTSLSVGDALVHGAQLVFIDALGCGGFSATPDATSSSQMRVDSVAMINHLTKDIRSDAGNTIFDHISVEVDTHSFRIGHFCISRLPSAGQAIGFTFETIGVRRNAMKVLRGMQLLKPILLEGAPGVGKTSLIHALAEQTGHDVVRINLSEQTDVSDLFGSDLPVEGEAGRFEWRDGPLLQALKSSHTWIVLDEMNLASQSVLEGLNACLDHRGEIFVSELGKTFCVNKTDTRIFGCQNPYREGGDRKGLPKSFLNRFTVVFIDSFTEEDLVDTASHMFPQIELNLLKKIVQFNQQLSRCASNRKFTGPEWEMNLRDIFRCCSLLVAADHTDSIALSDAIQLIYSGRMRCLTDREAVDSIFCNVFGHKIVKCFPDLIVTPESLFSGSTVLQRENSSPPVVTFSLNPDHVPCMSSIMKCVEKNWLAILVSDSPEDSSQILQALASLTGSVLKSQSVNIQTDAIELLGGFEQKDLSRRLRQLEQLVWENVLFEVRASGVNKACALFSLWNKYCNMKLSEDCSEKETILTRLRHMGTICQESLTSTALFNEISSLIESVSTMKDARCGGTFEWQDSHLISAMENGHWLVIEDANTCSPSVLDRLNSLFEPNGRIILTEQGSVDGAMRVVVPHPKFRIFMTMNPSNGELSRAMRNRGVEIFVSPADTQAGVIDVNSAIADPVVARVIRFPTDILVQADISNSNCLQEVICRLFLQQSSVLDFELRIKNVNHLRATTSPKSCETQFLGHPIDRRHLMYNNMSQSQIRAVNKWLLALYRESHSSILNLDSETRISKQSPTDEQYFALRLFSQIAISPASSKQLVRVIKSRFLARIAAVCENVTAPDDPEIRHIDDWIKLVQHFSNDVCLTRNEERSLDAHAALKSLKIWDQIEDHSHRKQVAGREIADLFGLVCSPDSNADEIADLESAISKSVNKNSRKVFSDSQPKHSSLFRILITIFERTAVSRTNVFGFFADSLFHQKLVGRVCIHPLHQFYAKKEKCLTEHVLHHLRDSQIVRKSLTTKKTRFNCNESPNITSLLPSCLSLRDATLASAQHHMDMMQDFKDLLLICIFAGDSFDPTSKSLAKIAKQWLEKLENSGAVAPPELPFELIRTTWKLPATADPSDPLHEATASAAFVLQVGLSSAHILAPILFVDPMEVREQEIIHLETQYDLMTTELALLDRIASVERGADYKSFVNKHPHVDMMTRHCEALENEIRTQKDLLVYRPNNKYERMRNSVTTFLKNVLSHVVQEMSDTLPALPVVSHFNQKTIRKWETTRCSIMSFANKMMQEYLDYWDILSPFVTSLFLIESGMHSLMQIMEFSRDPVQLNRLKVVNNFATQCCNYWDTDLLTTLRFCSDFEPDLTAFSLSLGQNDILSKLRLSALMDVKNLLSLQEIPQSSLIKSCVTILTHFVHEWKRNQEEKEAEKRKREATIHCLTFEGQADGKELEREEIARTFPSFTSSFSDLNIHDAASDDPVPRAPTTSDVCEVRLLIDLHSKILRPDSQIDLMTPYRLKHEVLSSLSASAPSLTSKIDDSHLLPLHLSAVKSCINKMSKSSSSSDPKFDIYHDFDEHEVEKCRQILSDFKKSIETILVQCPDHPTLIRLLKIVDRMYEFEVSSPLVRFLTGMELLLEQSQEWQKVYASRDYKITHHLQQITDLIIAWRKSEMSHWSNCLDIVSRKIKENDEDQWWFYLFLLVHEFDGRSVNEVIESIKRFVESSSIGQFVTRLQLLCLFSTHVKAVCGDHSLQNILNNITEFYQQFSSRVSSIHDSSRNPIEKEVRDFVRIQQWNDINYWSLKSSIDKSHRFLNKQMKKYESSLMMPVAPHLIIAEQSTHVVSPKSQIVLSDFLVSFDFSDNCLHSLSKISEKPELLIKNMHRYSRRLLENCEPIREQIEDEDESISSLIRELHVLQELKLDPAITDPEQRKKAIHHMSNRKRKSLSDLFKLLTGEGLSWTEGLQMFQTFDVNEVFSSVPCVSCDLSDESCNKYFFSCLARLSQLRSSLREPAKELSPGDLDRIRGFIGHMMNLLVHHRKSLAVNCTAFSLCEHHMSEAKSQKNPKQKYAFISFTVLLSKLEYLISNETSLPPNAFVINGIDLVQVRSLISRALNSHLDMSGMAEVLTQLTSLMPDANLLNQNFKNLLQSLSKHDEENKQTDAVTGSKGWDDLILISLKRIEKLVAIPASRYLVNDKLKNLLDFDQFWKSLGIPDFAERFQSQRSISDRHEGLFDIACQIVSQYLRVCHFFMKLSMEAHRVFGKRLHILLGIFVNLTRDGFCLPPESPPEQTTGEGTDQLTGTGMADGQGGEDVSDRITSEDQLEDAFQNGEENKEEHDEDRDLDNESGGIEMEGEFDGKEYDADGSQSEDEESCDELSADDKMGDVDGDDQPLNKKIWENEDVEQSDKDVDNADDGGKGEECGEREVVAADNNKKDQMDDEKEQASKNDANGEECENENQFDDEYMGEQPDSLKQPDAPQGADKDDKDLKLPEEMDLDADDSMQSEDSETESAIAESQPHVGEPDSESMISEADPDETNDDIVDLPDTLTDEMHHEDESQQNDAPGDEKAVTSNDASVRDQACPVNEDDGNDALTEPVDQNEEHASGDGPVGEDKDGHEGYQPTSSLDHQNGMSKSLKREPDSSHSLSDQSNRPVKRQRINPSQKEEDKLPRDKERDVAGPVQHVSDGDEGDGEAIDQADRNEALRSRPNREDESALLPDVDDDFLDQSSSDGDDNNEMNRISQFSGQRREKHQKETSAGADDADTDDPMPMTGDLVATENVSRGPESCFKTKAELLRKSESRDWMKLLSCVTKHVSEGREPLEEASLLWSECSRSVSSLLYELCQQLQLVLEPSKCSKLKGDYRTGKRISMRKVVAYIASQFRKDKIWLRRTKPSKRMYQIVLAVDDSRSMLDNETKMLAFQSLALLSKSLSLIEAGQLAVMSFGEEVKLLHSLNEPFSEDVGPRLLTHFTFDQKQTRVASLISTACDLFLQSKNAAARSDVSQLLLIISDGRGLFNDGSESLTTIVRRMNDTGIFCVFLILDNPQNNQSIFDITSVDFKDGKAIKKNYMDDFPFPFYIVLRDIKNMPLVLGESLRQWFELVSSVK